MRVLITLLITTTSLSGTAQSWVADGAVWHYNFWNVAVEGYYEYEYTHDTLIDGQNCQVIQGNRYQFYNPGEPELISVSALSTEYIYTSGDTVFYRDHDAFFVLLNFDAEVGDSWVVSTTPTDFCTDTSRAIVLETGTIEIHGETYKTITIEPTANSAWGFKGVFVERFGNIAAGSGPFLSPFPMAYECEDISDDMIIEWDMLGFSCFQDNSFSLYQPYSDYCDYYTGVAQDELIQISVYPNPATDFLTVENSEFDNYEIIDLSGKTVQNGQLIDSRIDLRQLSKGTYFLKMPDAFARFIVGR